MPIAVSDRASNADAWPKDSQVHHTIISYPVDFIIIYNLPEYGALVEPVKAWHKLRRIHIPKDLKGKALLEKPFAVVPGWYIRRSRIFVND